jgi:cytochrome c biogenesis protein CcmG/thiol:disulfide interchange protein DsbE
MKFNWLMVLPFALFLGIAGIWLWQLQNNQFALQQGVDTTALRSVQQGNPAPDLNLDPLADKTLLTRDMLEGEGLVAVNFFASWCPPCRVEHPILTALAEAGPAAIRGELQRPGGPGAVLPDRAGRSL